MREDADIKTRVCGIPCGIVIDSFVHQEPHRGSAQTCWSDIDYYGYTEMEWHLIDRKGYHAKWLERKMEKQDKLDVESEIFKHYQDGV